jgi:hypothetical protein
VSRPWVLDKNKRGSHRSALANLCFRASLLLVLTSIACGLGCTSHGRHTDAGLDADSDATEFDADTGAVEPTDADLSDSLDTGTIEAGDAKYESSTKGDAISQPDGSPEGSQPCPDNDGDGYADINCGGDDCDDTNASIHPGDDMEVCNNGVDDDCDPKTPDIFDKDGDGYNCTDDCDDNNPHVNPSRPEICGNDINDDCNEDTPDLLDKDGDGYECNVDCDDNNPNVYPGHPEICGNGINDDCDPKTPDLGDLDNDGWRCDKDCNDNDPTLPGATFFCGADFLYVEDFESGAGGWTASGDQPGWELGEPRGEHIVTAASGDNAWVTVLNGYYSANSTMILTSPIFDMSGLVDDPIVMFKRTYHLGTGDQVWLELSLDGGGSWTHVDATATSENFYNAAQSFTGVSNEWLLAKTVLTHAAGSSNVRIRFVFMSDSDDENDGFALDDVRIVDKVLDVKAIGLDVPLSGCGDRSTGVITLTVRNDSSVPLSNFDVAYVVDNGASHVETVTTEVEPDHELPYAFVQTVDLSDPGNHHITATMMLSSEQDSDMSDNSLSADSYSFINYGTGDYDESFEKDGGGWATSGQNSSWARGIPIGDVINGAADGQYAWKTNPWGSSNRNEMSYLTSPCFDFSDLAPTAPNPVFVFDQNYDINGNGWFEMSLDGGETWNKLGTSDTGFNWYNDSLHDSWAGRANPGHQWQTAYHSLDGAAGHDLVQLRFAFQSNGDTAGMGVDQPRIFRTFVDPRLTDYTIPSFICEGAESFPVSIKVINGGNSDLSNFQISYQVDDQDMITETATDVVAPGMSTDYIFTTKMIAPTVGTHELRFTITVPSDFNLDNSSLDESFSVNQTMSASGYDEDFESDNGGWSTYGESSSWQYGTPLGVSISFITTAAGGSGKAWVTNLYGDYNNNEHSYLMSPCLNFSAFSSDPTIEFDQIFQTEASVDMGWLEVSTDCGTSWTKVGDSTTGTNWYNDADDDSWSGTSGSAGQWRTASHILTGVSEQPAVLLRFVMSSNEEVQEEGFGIDNISFVE